MEAECSKFILYLQNGGGSLIQKNQVEKAETQFSTNGRICSLLLYFVFNFASFFFLFLLFLSFFLIIGQCFSCYVTLVAVSRAGCQDAAKRIYLITVFFRKCSRYLPRPLFCYTCKDKQNQSRRRRKSFVSERAIEFIESIC